MLRRRSIIAGPSDMLMAALVTCLPVEDSAAVGVLIEQVAPTGPVRTRDKGHTSTCSRTPALREQPVQRGAWFGSRPSRPDG